MRESVTFDAILDEIRLHASHPQNENVLFILVEGDADIRLFRSLFNQDFCKIKAIPGGCLKLEQGLITLHQELSQVIGVRDADFMHLEGHQPHINVLFITDFHDIETLMLSSDEAFKSVVNEFYHNNFRITELRHFFLSSVQFLGYFRWYNQIHNLEFSFKEIGISDLINTTTFVLDELHCIQNVIARSPNCRLRDAETILSGVQALINQEHDLLQVCCGHDVSKAMAHYFNMHSSSKAINGDRIQSHFRTAYNLSEFSRTNLHRDVSAWALANNFQLF